MGPNYDRQLDFGVPTTLPEAGNSPQGQEQLPQQQPGRTPESLGPAGNQPVAAAPPTSMPMVPVNPLAQQSNSATLPTTTLPSNANPQLADDKDLIEKVWVEKAKKIITSTRSDPHEQTKEINHFKADYLKKRYNKDLKVIEE